MKRLVVAMMLAFGMTVATGSFAYAKGGVGACKKECTAKKKDCVKGASKDKAAKKKCREEFAACAKGCKK